MSYFRGGFQDKWPVSRLNSACLPHHPFSQRSAVPARGFFGLPGEPVPCFHPLSIGEGWSAGRRPGSLAIGSLRPALRSAGLHAELPGPKSLEGGGGPVARGPLARKPGRLSALHRGTRCRRPRLAQSSGVAIDGARDGTRHGVGTGMGKEQKAYSNCDVNSVLKEGALELLSTINTLSRHSGARRRREPGIQPKFF